MDKNMIIDKNFLWIENIGEKNRLSRYMKATEVLHNIDDKRRD